MLSLRLGLGLVSFGLGLGLGLEPCGLVNITGIGKQLHRCTFVPYIGGLPGTDIVVM